MKSKILLIIICVIINLGFVNFSFGDSKLGPDPLEIAAKKQKALKNKDEKLRYGYDMAQKRLLDFANLQLPSELAVNKAEVEKYLKNMVDIERDKYEKKKLLSEDGVRLLMYFNKKTTLKRRKVKKKLEGEVKKEGGVINENEIEKKSGFIKDFGVSFD